MTPLGDLVTARLSAMGMSVREAARRTGMDEKTLYDLIRRTTSRHYRPVIREELTRLGLTPLEVEYAAALTAGFEVTPPEVTPREFARALRMRALDSYDVEFLDRRIMVLLDERGEA